MSRARTQAPAAPFGYLTLCQVTSSGQISKSRPHKRSNRKKERQPRLGGTGPGLSAMPALRLWPQARFLGAFDVVDEGGGRQARSGCNGHKTGVLWCLRWGFQVERPFASKSECSCEPKRTLPSSFLRSYHRMPCRTNSSNSDCTSFPHQATFHSGAKSLGTVISNYR